MGAVCLEGCIPHPGEKQLICLLGPSGCGKTTLLNLIAGFIAPTSGRVLMEGTPISRPGPDRGVVFQDANLFPWMTVLDNIRFGLRQQGRPPGQVTSLALECLELVGMTAQAEAWPISLSGGMRQRVAIARILALQPKAMLLDEPFSALDANSRERLQDELLAICGRRPCTVLYITHGVEEAAYLANGSLLWEARRTLFMPKSGCLSTGSETAVLHNMPRQSPCCVDAWMNSPAAFRFPGSAAPTIKSGLLNTAVMVKRKEHSDAR